jgi:hypothetical protein
MKLIFFQSNKANWTKLQVELSDAIGKYLACGKDFEIEFSEVKQGKSWLQCKGIHKLAQLLAYRLKETNNINYTLDTAKLWIKWNFDFTEKVTEEDAISEAINERNKAKLSGVEMTREQFLNLVETFKTNLKKPRSFATATKEEMMDLIEKIHALADRMNWPECKLTSQEMASLVEFYNNKEGK